MAAENPVAALLDLLLRRRLGYVLTPWPASLWGRVQALAEQSGEAPLALVTRALTSGDGRFVDQLVAAATVTHTAFFRHPEQFARFEQHLRARRRSVVRVLCLGCSRGEEAYSLALTAEGAGALARIEAVDVNTDAIAYAELGHYDARAARNMPGADPVRGWTAPHRLRERLSFEQSSLIDALAAREGRRYDYIFCRNVLIYFDPEAAYDVLVALAQRLAPGGVLVVAPTEALACLPPTLQPDDPTGWLVRVEDGQPRSRPIVRPLLISLRPTRPTPVVINAEPPPQPPAEPDPSAFLSAALTPNLQQHGDSEVVLREWLESRPQDATAWFLLGEALLRRREYAQASVAFEQAVAHAAHATLADSATLAAAAQRRAIMARSADAGSQPRSRATDAANDKKRRG